MRTTVPFNAHLHRSFTHRTTSATRPQAHLQPPLIAHLHRSFTQDHFGAATVWWPYRRWCTSLHSGSTTPSTASAWRWAAAVNSTTSKCWLTACWAGGWPQHSSTRGGGDGFRWRYLCWRQGGVLAHMPQPRCLPIPPIHNSASYTAQSPTAYAPAQSNHPKPRYLAIPSIYSSYTAHPQLRRLHIPSHRAGAC